MTKNALLNVAITLCKFLRLLCVLTFLIFSVFFIHYQINPSSYKNVHVKSEMNANGIFLINTNHKIHIDGKVSEDSDVFVLNKLKWSSLYFNYIKFSVLVLLSFLCLKEFQKVIDSVKEIKTFQKTNVSSFKKIGKYLLVTSIITSFSCFTFQGGGTSSFQIPFYPLVLALLAYVMSEIFKEGNNLSEENRLTV